MINQINTELITTFMAENNLSKAAFCRLCKINNGTLNKILSNEDNLRLIPILKIARAMNIKLHELFE